MLAITEALSEVTDRLTTAGIPHAIDPRDLNLPGVLLTVRARTWDTLDADASTVTIEAIAIAPDTGQPLHTLDVLDTLISRCAAVLDPISPITEATAGTVLLPNHGADPLPSLTAPLSVSLT